MDLRIYTSDGTPTATEVCNGLRALMVADSNVNVSGTTTLIMTAKVVGTAFTYSGSSNLTEVLTTANVPGVAYSGNWLCTSVNSSTATTLNSGVPIVAGTWYNLRAIVNAAGTQVSYYINGVLIGTSVVTVTSSALHFVFKLEKTVGTTSRTTSIDYLSWRRVRS